MRTNAEPSLIERHLRPSWLTLLCASAALSSIAQAQKAYVTNASSGTVSVIDTRTNTIVSTIPVGLSPARPALAADGRSVFVPNGGSDDVSVVSASSDAVLRTIPVEDSPAVAAAAPNGARLYVGCANGRVVVVDPELGVQVSAIQAGAPTGGSGSVNGLAVSPDGSRLYALWGNLIVIDTASESVVNAVYAGNYPSDLALSRDGARLYVPCVFGYGDFNFYGSVAVLDAASGALASSIFTWATPNSIALTPDGSFAALSTPSRFVNTGYGAGYLPSPWVERLDLASGTLSGSTNAGAPAAGVALTPDGARAYAAIPTGNRVAVIDVASNTLVTSVAVGTAPAGVVIAPLEPKKARWVPGSRRP